MNGFDAQQYERRVGRRLREVRRQKGLTLQDVEAAPGSDFKTSALSAYERGERAISVPRLQRLAQFYGVPVDQLLPSDLLGDEEEEPRGDVVAPGAGDDRRQGPEDLPTRLRVDLRQLEQLSDPEAKMLRRYVEAIQRRRGDFNGRVLTLRHDDLRHLAWVSGTDAVQLLSRLSNLQLCLSSER